MLDDLAQLNHLRARELGDPETLARINAYEMAYRMQTSVPELTDIARRDRPRRSPTTAPRSRKPGSYAANCLLARRLLERGVRFVQLFHRGWDQHIAIARQLPNQCRDVDQPTAALIKDLRQRGLLDDTLVVFATEFGRTVFSQGELGDPGMGRDHHGRCFTVWLAGAGVQPGIEYGKTDDFCYNIVENPVHLREPARDDPALPGDRSRAIYVPVPRARCAAHRGGGSACGRRHPGVDCSCDSSPSRCCCSLALRGQAPRWPRERPSVSACPAKR